MHILHLSPREEGGKLMSFAALQSPPDLPHFLRVVNVDIIGPDSQVKLDF